MNAKKGSGENLYKYGKSENSEEELYHMALKNLEEEEEQCLTFSLNASENLVAAGVDCQTRLKPLCLQIKTDNLDIIEDKCQECNPDIYQTKCQQWTSFETVDGYSIEGAEICVKPCGTEVFENSNNFCQVN